MRRRGTRLSTSFASTRRKAPSAGVVPAFRRGARSPASGHASTAMRARAPVAADHPASVVPGLRQGGDEVQVGAGRWGAGSGRGPAGGRYRQPAHQHGRHQGRQQRAVTGMRTMGRPGRRPQHPEGGRVEHVGRCGGPGWHRQLTEAPATRSAADGRCRGEQGEGAEGGPGRHPHVNRPGGQQQPDSQRGLPRQGSDAHTGRQGPSREDRLPGVQPDAGFGHSAASSMPAAVIARSAGRRWEMGG